MLTVHYFKGIRGRAESIRMMLRYGGIAYKDEELTLPEWPVSAKNTVLGGCAQAILRLLPSCCDLLRSKRRPSDFPLTDSLPLRPLTV